MHANNKWKFNTYSQFGNIIVFKIIVVNYDVVINNCEESLSVKYLVNLFKKMSCVLKTVISVW